MIAAWVENNNTNTAQNTLVWLNLSQGIAANSNVVVYMNIMSGSIMSANGPTGEAAQLSPTYGEYENIKQVMLPGLEYQIYYGTNGVCDSVGYQTQLYNAPLGDGTTINGCNTLVSSTPIFNTSEIGTTQQGWRGGTWYQAIINMQCGQTGGPLPNPPLPTCGVSTYNTINIKAIGFIQSNSSSNYNNYICSLSFGDGTAASTGTSFATSNGVDWLGGNVAPNNMYNDWQDSYNTGACYPTIIGDNRLETDYFYSSKTCVNCIDFGMYKYTNTGIISYFHAAYPPNGVMPSTSIGYSLESFASVTIPSIMQGQNTQLKGSANGGTSPYTYQWLEEAPGASSFTAISGATCQNYLFTTTTLTGALVA